MGSEPVPGAAGYEEHADALADQYEHITFEDVHREVLHLFPPPPVDVLDIGAGSGRDAAALARRGHRVVAVEPTAGLREQGLRRHAALPIQWVDDHLPHLHTLRQRPEQFGLVLLTAVWMHLDTNERTLAMQALAALTMRGGLVSMTLRHGPVPEGRRMFDVSAEETAALAAPLGLRHHWQGRRGDMLGRADVHWSLLVLRRD